MHKHRINPLELDMAGDWDGVVKFDHKTKQFVRYIDRNGEHKSPISEMTHAS